MTGEFLRCAARGDDLMVRVAADTADAVLVGPDGHAEDDDLRRWVGRGVADATSPPPK